MNPFAMLHPMIALALLTLGVLLLIPYQRFKASFKGQVRASDFRYGESANVPGHVSLPNRNLMNLLELPVLFYTACLTYFVTGKTDALALNLAWVYVALRLVHSIIHLSYNRVEHRLVAFALSNVALTALWLRLLFALT